MSKHKTKLGRQVTAKPAAGPARWHKWLPFAALALLVLIFYWEPLTSPAASIQWDAVDVHYSPQKYFGDQVRAGKLPFWTPYVFSGFPFLADPQVGAWYPLNWPFFLAGVTPGAIELELALHAFIAGLGAFFLARRFLDSPPAAFAAGVLYAFSGFFAAHSSHVGMFQAAAWLPWAAAALLAAFESGALAWAVLAGGAAGLMGLAGHFQTALYGLAALAIFTVAEIVRRPRFWGRPAASFAAACVVAVLLAAVVVLPGLELAGQSVRSHADTFANRDGTLPPAALGTLFYPNLLGALSGDYKGPADITQYYFYSGILLVPLAAAGFLNRRLRLPAAAVVTIAIWYALGPAAGLYRLVAFLPGFHSIRGPVHGWFAVALALALLAGAGIEVAGRRFRKAYFLPALLIILFADVFYWNSAANRLAYARASFEELYGRNEEMLGRAAAAQPPLTRFHAPSRLPALGPLNGPLDVRLEATYGYNPLALQAYVSYLEAARHNPTLIDALNVSRTLNMQSGYIDDRPTALPRAYFPRTLRFAATDADSLRLLGGLQPPQDAIVTGTPPGIVQDPAARAEIVTQQEGSLRIRTFAASPSLLRIAVPFYPGWRASAGGRELPLVRVDHALLGVVIPGGRSEVLLTFRSNYFAAGAALSLAGLIVTAAAFLFVSRRAQPAFPAPPQSRRHHPA